MNHQDIHEGRVVERYLQGKLTAAEEQAFEERLLADPELLEELELTERLREGLKRHAANLRSGAGRRAVPSGWRSFLAAPQYAAAASVLLALSLALSAALLVQNAEMRGVARTASTGGAARVLPLVTVRGNDGANVVRPPAAGETTVFMIDPGFTEYDVYRATLTRAGDESPVLEVGGLARTYEDFVAVSVPASLLTAGDYEIELEGRMDDWSDERSFDAVTRTSVTVRSD